MAKIVVKETSKLKKTGFTDKSKDLIRILVRDDEAKGKILHQIEKQGPKHKQLLSKILLTRLYKLVKTIEKSCEVSFKLQNGEEINIKHKKHQSAIPIELPDQSFDCKENKKEFKILADAPEHELLAYMMSLQVIEWAINSIPLKVIAPKK